tara:strand:- start:4692 stop:5201 length:510 start_codon:yes stop_codon:yes gene_type:complete
MAHFAKIGLNNKVMTVTVVADTDCQAADGSEIEDVGVSFLENLTGWPIWKKTSYNTHGNKYYNDDGSLASDQSKAYRGNFATVGSVWDDDAELFYPPKVYSSWTKDPSNATWKSPVTYPSTTTYTVGSDTKNYNIGWNENLQRWEATLEKAIGNPTIYWDTSSSSWTDI